MWVTGRERVACDLYHLHPIIQRLGSRVISGCSRLPGVCPYNPRRLRGRHPRHQSVKAPSLAGSALMAAGITQPSHYQSLTSLTPRSSSSSSSSFSVSPTLILSLSLVYTHPPFLSLHISIHILLSVTFHLAQNNTMYVSMPRLCLRALISFWEPHFRFNVYIL